MTKGKVPSTFYPRWEELVTELATDKNVRLRERIAERAGIGKEFAAKHLIVRIYDNPNDSAAATPSHVAYLLAIKPQLAYELYNRATAIRLMSPDDEMRTKLTNEQMEILNDDAELFDHVTDISARIAVDPC